MLTITSSTHNIGLGTIERMQAYNLSPSEQNVEDARPCCKIDKKKERSKSPHQKPTNCFPKISAPIGNLKRTYKSDQPYL
jgi:hypothetical protein